MKKDKYIIKVIFRKFSDGEIIALLPYESWNYKEDISCYMHIVQHCEADYNHILRKTKLAKENEYNDLKQEMEAMGYNFKVITKKEL